MEPVSELLTILGLESELLAAPKSLKVELELLSPNKIFEVGSGAFDYF